MYRGDRCRFSGWAIRSIPGNRVSSGKLYTARLAGTEPVAACPYFFAVAFTCPGMGLAVRIVHAVDYEGLFGDEIAHGETFRFGQREELRGHANVRELHAGDGMTLRPGFFLVPVASESESLLV